MSQLKSDALSKAASYLSLPVATSPSPSAPPSPGPSLLSPPNPNIQHVHHHKRLLMPTIRPPRQNMTVPRSPPRVKVADSRLSRARHLAVPSICTDPIANTNSAAHWFESGCRFEVVQEQVEVSGYQLYAVEKWIVERTRPVVVLAVYTGDPANKITVTALSPASSLSNDEAEAEWEKALHDLRRDGARPKATGFGTLMATSLANFRSDYTIVHVPTGNYMDVREQLFTNINLLRMGCSGRSALTLEEPSDTTKDRFIQMYNFPDKIRSPEHFNSTVLELVRLIQAALSIFSMFDINADERNGLLCDVTADGIQTWISAIGEPLLNVEPMERVADPTVVAGLLSTVMVARNRLYALGYHHLVPKDPFVEPHVLISALYAFQHSAKSSPNPTGDKADIVTLTLPLLRSIEVSYLKSRQTDQYKVHKVLLNKLDDLTTDLRATGTERDGDFGDGSGGLGTDLASGTAKLDMFVKSALTNRKEGAQSVRWLWTARAEQVDRKRRERVMSDVEREAEEKAAAVADAKSTDDEGDEVRPWSNRVQKKIEFWAGLNRKKQSIDLTAKAKSPDSLTSTQSPSNIPTVVISAEDGNESQATSPIIPPPTASPMVPRDSEESGISVSDYDRLVTEFNRKRPSPKAGYQSRVSSWSDPISAREILDDDPSKRKRKPSRLGQTSLTVQDDDGDTASVDGLALDIINEDFSEPKRRILRAGAKRRHSFASPSSFPYIRVLPIERMRIDVELCGQLLVMLRRERHLESVLSCLQVLTGALSTTNSALHADHQEHQRKFPEAEDRLKVIAEIERERSIAETMMQDTNALVYESAQFRVADMWRAASASRLKVFAMREKVFGAGRKLPQGSSGAHGHYNRVQWRLAGGQQLVDSLGRTEEEAQEEEGLPKFARLEEEDDQVDAVPHPGLAPTWLLRFINTWGARWGARKADKTLSEPENPETLGKVDRQANLSTVPEVEEESEDQDS